MDVQIDVNRGVEVRRERETGIRVYMYIDEPGVYLNAFAKPLSKEFAEKAGFPVEQQTRSRIAREKIADFTKKMNEELAYGSLEDAEVLAEANGYRVLKMAYGNAVVVDENGEKMTPAPVPVKAAKELLAALAPEEKKPLEKAPPKA